MRTDALMWWLLCGQVAGEAASIWAVVLTADPAGWAARCAWAGTGAYCVAARVTDDGLTPEEREVLADIPTDRVLMHPDAAVAGSYALTPSELDYLERLVAAAADYLAVHGPRVRLGLEAGGSNGKLRGTQETG